LLERLFAIYGGGEIRSILDLGCGTGNHALLLARRGYQVVGVDRSEAMLAHARRKAAQQTDGKPISFYQGDIRFIDLGQVFDVVLMMFAVLGYQQENSDVIAALQAVRRHLRPEGLFIFDVWYGPAVLYERPSQRIKVISTENGQILRVASADLDVRRHLCTVHFHVWRLEGDRLVAKTVEHHSVRYFFPLELELFLEFTGLKLLRLGAFHNWEQEPNETTWNVLGVAKAV
jgi:SAM-dependent methyltransferase